MKIKWAQMTKLERAYTKFKSCNDYSFRHSKLEDLSLYAARERNRYYQLLQHWCKLKKEAESTETANS
jgi:hypothetical protein